MPLSPHYLLPTVGTVGDMLPFIRLGQVLSGLGRRVTLLTNPAHAGLAREAGLEVVEMGTEADYQRLLANPNMWDPKKGFSALFDGYGDQLTQMVQGLRWLAPASPRVVIAHPLAVAGAVMARECGLVDVVAAAYLAPSNLRTCHDPLTLGHLTIPRWVPFSWRRALWRVVEKGWIDPAVVPQINVARRSLGLPPVDTFLDHMTQAPDLSVALFPSWFGEAKPDWPVPMLSGDFLRVEPGVQQGLMPDLSDFLAGGDKPVVFTPGTGHLHAAAFFDRALSAVQSLGLRAVFLTRERAQVPAPLPPSVLWQPYVPLPALLPRAAALVHHGGIGTTAEALRAGIPQLVAPFAWDQFDNGARVQALGVGLVMPARSLRKRKLARALQTLCASGEMRARCSQVARRFTAPHDTAAWCGDIERLALQKWRPAA